MQGPRLGKAAEHSPTSHRGSSLAAASALDDGSQLQRTQNARRGAWTLSEGSCALLTAVSSVPRIAPGTWAAPRTSQLKEKASPKAVGEDHTEAVSGHS